MIRAAKGAKAVIALAALVGDGACEIDHDETVAINIESTKLLCDVVRLTPSINRVVFASSCSVYGATEGLILNEGSRLNPVSFYARSRIVSEGILTRQMDGAIVYDTAFGHGIRRFAAHASGSDGQHDDSPRRDARASSPSWADRRGVRTCTAATSRAPSCWLRKPRGRR